MKYIFDGNWQTEIQLRGFSKLKFENESLVKEFIIRDFLDEELEPFQEQINTINYIIDNQDQIVENQLNKIWENWEQIYLDYSIEDYDEFPVIKDKNDLRQIVGIRTIYIQPLYKNGFAYYGLEGNCMWDEEHGFGSINHQNRIIEIGGAEVADAGGSEVNDNPDNKRPNKPLKPKLYEPHPTFGTLKPSHKEANLDYPHELIQQQLNEEFIEYLKNNPNVDYINPDDWQERTYLKTACMSNNVEIFDLLIKKAKNLNKAIYSSHKRKNINFIERLIERGADIHETHFGSTILSDAIEQHLRKLSVNLTEEQMDINKQKMIDYYNQPHVNKFSPVVKEMKMHPKDWLEWSRKYIKELMRFGIELDNQKIDYVKNGLRNNPDALKTVENEVMRIMNNYE